MRLELTIGGQCRDTGKAVWWWVGSGRWVKLEYGCGLSEECHGVWFRFLCKRVGWRHVKTFVNIFQ